MTCETCGERFVGEQKLSWYLFHTCNPRTLAEKIMDDLCGPSREASRQDIHNERDGC